MINKNIAYKFAKWEVSPLEDLKDCKVYLLKEKVLKGEILSREEKDWIYEFLRQNSYSRVGIPLLGWMFDFSEILKMFYVEYTYGIIEKVYAPDKMSIRNKERAIKRITLIK